MSSSIYDTRLQNKIRPNRQRLIKESKTTDVPDFLMVGNTKPNFDFKTNRMLQPISSSKKPLQQAPFLPKNNLIASGLGGKKPVQIDYVTSERKQRIPRDLIWETNIVRELRQNVYPDGTPKNNVPAQSADSAYIERMFADKKLVDLEKSFELRGGKGARPHPDAVREAELKKLENLIAETKYGPTYKNVALSAENHAKLASKNAEEIRAELDALKREALVHKEDVVDALENIGGGKLSPPAKSKISTETYFVVNKEDLNAFKDHVTELEGKFDPKDSDFIKSLDKLALELGIDKETVSKTKPEDLLQKAKDMLDKNVQTYEKDEVIPLDIIEQVRLNNTDLSFVKNEIEQYTNQNISYYEDQYAQDPNNIHKFKDDYIKNIIINENPYHTESDVVAILRKFKKIGNNTYLKKPEKIKNAYKEFLAARTPIKAEK